MPDISVYQHADVLADTRLAAMAQVVVPEYTALVELLAERTGISSWSLAVTEFSGTLSVELSSRGTAASDIVQITRMFGTNGTVRHDYFVVGKNHQNKGLSDLVLRASVSAMDKLKLPRSVIMISANLDVGGYAWLRRGFWPVEGKKEVTRALRDTSLNFFTKSAGKTPSAALLAKWESLSEAEARVFVLSPEFRDYKDALLGKDWKGSADLSDPLTRDALTRGTVAAYNAHLAREQARLSPKTANVKLRDATLRHQIDVRRFTAGEVKKIDKLMLAADAELVRLLRDRLAQHVGKPLDLTSKRYQQMLSSIQEARTELMKTVTQTARADLQALGVIEGSAEAAILAASVPIELKLNAVDNARLRAIATSKPFQGKILKDWFSTLARGDQERLKQAIQLGLGQGENLDSIVRRVAGTRANKYADGALSITRRDAAAVVRTAANHVSTSAREEIWKENSALIGGLIWSATLDGRTTMVCASRDGHWAPSDEDSVQPAGFPALVPEGARPPAHFNCRSTMIAYINEMTLGGERPAVMDSRTRAARERDFRRLAKETGRPIQEIRREWASQNVGQVPASTNYGDWLRSQPPAFQDEVLGPSKAALFRRGGMELGQFVDRDGSELTLAELRDRDPAAFIRAGID